MQTETNTLDEFAPRSRFEAGYRAGYEAGRDDAADGATFDGVIRIPDAFYVAGYNRGFIWSIAGWPADSSGPWREYVEWAHESMPRLAAELIEVEYLPADA